MIKIVNLRYFMDRYDCIKKKKWKYWYEKKIMVCYILFIWFELEVYY